MRTTCKIFYLLAFYREYFGVFNSKNFQREIFGIRREISVDAGSFDKYNAHPIML